ncbi:MULTISPECIES: hypothetical protein [Acidithrix]|uniref:Uncharacterized protein n=1 Tax=Acidithrix ferrooxidans TaxID=1280514 RepID=A0A0D8HN48_9ACTN|nr:MULTISPECIES: hypothetical protein [Acidithrix]KJF18536.1 hypothetical protein AXFE_05830 [Acidithrix ferrooxidans]
MSYGSLRGSWTSDALAVRGIADWRGDERDVEELWPLLILEKSQNYCGDVALAYVAIGDSNDKRRSSVYK